MTSLSLGKFADWLTRYGLAWETRDPDAASALFSADAEYHWIPFVEPKRGPSEIAAAWSFAVSQQRDVRFRFTVLSVSGDLGVAHWHTKLVRIEGSRDVEIDGILTAEIAENGLCRVFREWWHSTE